jgi:hypothetical protein
MGTKIDLEQLTNEIRDINIRRKLYHVLKTELSKIGYWKNKERGNPAKGYINSKEKL